MQDGRHIIQSARLTLRPLCAADFAALFAIQGDAAAMRYTYTAASQAECTSRLQTYEALRCTRGFAPWVVVQRSTDSVIGWDGLAEDPFDPAGRQR